MQRLAEDGIHNAASVARRIPIEREPWPLCHHAGASCRSDDKRDHEHDEAQDAIDGQSQWPAADEDDATTQQLRLVGPPQRQEPAVQNEKCAREKCREDRPLKAERLPEHVSVTERPEPEGVDVIR